MKMTGQQVPDDPVAHIVGDMAYGTVTHVQAGVEHNAPDSGLLSGMEEVLEALENCPGVIE